MKTCKAKFYEFSKNIDVKLLKSVIYVLDAYRVHRYLDLEKYDKEIREGKLGRRFAEKWKKDIHPTLLKMAKLPFKIPGVQKLLQLRLLFKLIKSFCFTLALLFFADAVFQVFSTYSLISKHSAILAPILFLMVAVSGVSEVLTVRKISMVIDSYYKTHPKKFGLITSRLRDVVQGLIYGLSMFYKKYDTPDNDDKRIELYNIDYKGIKILKKPKLIRKYYEVLVE